MATKKESENKKLEKKVVQNARKEVETIFYIGPTVKRGMLEKGTNFREGVSKEVEELQKKHPSIVPLFVKKDVYIKSLNDLNIQGTRINILLWRR